MRSGLGHYARKGWNGSHSAAVRLGGTSRTAGTLYDALSSLASGEPAPGSPLDPALLQGKSADEVTNAIIEAVRPVDGTQDAEANRSAIHSALSELLEHSPEANFLDLSDDDRLFVIERFLAGDIFNRVELDLGTKIKEKAATISTALSRLREIKNFIRQTVSAAFRKLSGAKTKPTARRIERIASQTIQDTFAIFEDAQ